MIEEYYPLVIKTDNFELAAKYGYYRFIAYSLKNKIIQSKLLRMGLQQAIIYGHLEIVRQLINIVDYDFGIITASSKTFRTDIIDLVLDKYPDILLDLSLTVLRLVNDKLSLYLINKIGNLPGKFFFIATPRSNLEVIRTILDKKSWENSVLVQILKLALRSGRLDIVYLLRDKCPLDCKLHEVIGSCETIQYLLDNKEWTQEELNMALAVSSLEDDLETVRILLENSARDVNSCALINAISRDIPGMAEILLELNPYTRVELENVLTRLIPSDYQELIQLINQKLNNC